MSPDASEQPALLKLLQRASLPTGFERWRIEIAVGGQRPTDAAEWAGVFVLVETGQLEVECLAGGSRAFGEGDLLVLGWLPLRRLRNVGRTSVRLLCVRRAGHRPKDALLRVFRAHRRETSRAPSSTASTGRASSGCPHWRTATAACGRRRSIPTATMCSSSS